MRAALMTSLCALVACKGADAPDVVDPNARCDVAVPTAVMSGDHVPMSETFGYDPSTAEATYGRSYPVREPEPVRLPGQCGRRRRTQGHRAPARSQTTSTSPCPCGHA